MITQCFATQLGTHLTEGAAAGQQHLQIAHQSHRKSFSMIWTR